jgi:integrase
MAEKRVVVWVQQMQDRKNLALQWIDPATHQRRTQSSGTADPQEAEAARADLEYELAHGRHQETSRMTWQRFRELFEDERLAGLRPDTLRNYRVTMDLFEKLCKPTNLRAINERTISAFAAGLRKRAGKAGDKAEPGTVKMRLQFLRSVLRWANQQKLISECPRFPTVKLAKKRPQAVPTELFERLLEKAPDANMRSYLLCGWLAGLRLNEALALEWKHTDKAPWVDFERQRIWLPAEFVKATEDQWVPLDPSLRDALERLPRQGRKVFRFVGPKGKPVSETAVSKRIAALADEAGVRLTMKGLRRGFGCRYAGKVSAQVLQKLMRHSNIAVTMDYYVNVDDAVEAAVLGTQRSAIRNSKAPADG